MDGAEGSADDGHLGREMTNVQVKQDRYARVAQHVDHGLAAIEAHDRIVDMQGPAEEKGLYVLKPTGIFQLPKAPEDGQGI